MLCPKLLSQKSSSKDCKLFGSCYNPIANHFMLSALSKIFPDKFNSNFYKLLGNFFNPLNKYLVSSSLQPRLLMVKSKCKDCKLFGS